MKRKIKTTARSIEAGQVWALDDSNIHVTLLGRTLVHYKHFKNGATRAPSSLTNKDTLEQFLRTNRAVLTETKATVSGAQR